MPRVAIVRDHPGVSRNPRSAGPLAALLAAVAALSGCAAAGGSGGADADAVCTDAFIQVAAISAADATPTDLDLAVRRCRSLTDWLAAAAEHPEALRGASPVEYLEGRCAAPDAGLAGYTLCGLLRVATATATPAPTKRPAHTPKPTKAPPRRVAMWDTFRTHFYTVESRGVNLVYRAIDGMESSTFRSVRPAIGPFEDLNRWAVQEANWLDDHPAHKCFAHVQRAWRRGIGLVAQATRLAVPAFKRRDPTKLTRSGELLIQAGGSFELAEERFQRLGPTGCD
jgi:hypothetical protein